MANNEVIDGNLSVLGNLTISGTQTDNGGQIFNGTVTTSGQLSVAGAVVINSSVTSGAAGVATLNAKAGVVTTDALSAATQSIYTLAISNSSVSSTDIVLVNINNGTNSGGLPALSGVTVANGKITVGIVNAGVSAGSGAFNGTLKVAFLALK